ARRRARGTRRLYVGDAAPAEPAAALRPGQHRSAQPPVLPESDLRLLILGLSNLVQRRVLPALQHMDELDGVDVASRSRGAGWDRPDWLAGETFHDYDDA